MTSIPDLADITNEIGGNKVKTFSLAKGRENIHYIPAKSSFLPKIRRAHLVICLGLEMEVSWLPDLVSASRNPRVKKGAPGWIEAYRGVEILEKPTGEDMKTLQHHRLGNPHFNTGPYCGKIMAENIARALIGIDNKNKEFYRNNLIEYSQKIADMETRLQKKALPLKGMRVISYHADLSYFCKYYKIELLGTLEPKPGVPPNVRHLSNLIKTAGENKVKLVLYHQAQNGRLPRRIAREIGAVTVCFANMVGSRKSISNWIELQEYNLQIMLDAVAGGGPK